MIYKSLTKEAKNDYYENWHDWFAWYPVRINDYEKVWLCKVKRIGYRRWIYNNYMHFEWVWRYELV